jgi:hypothetical protein
VNKEKNPFYRPWVNQIDISKLLGTEDLDDGIYSMLDCTSLEEIMQSSLAYSSNTRSDKDVPTWLRNPLPLILTVTNLRGVPYKILFSGESEAAHEMSLHQDHMAYAVPELGPGAQENLAPDFEAHNVFLSMIGAMKNQN